MSTRAFPTPRSFLVPSIIALAIGGTVWLVGGNAPVTDDPRVPGAWADAEMSGLAIELAPDGLYAWAPGGRLASCGRWRVERETVHLRETWGAKSGTGAVLVSQPGLLLGSAIVGTDGRLALTLRVARPDGPSEAWRLAPRPPLRETLSPTDQSRLTGSCGFR